MPPRDRNALAAMERAWHEAQRQALENALLAVPGHDVVAGLGGRRPADPRLVDRRGEQLLLVLSHAAALDEMPPGTVAAWIRAQDLRPALAILSRSGPLGPRADALRQIPQPAHAAVWATTSRLFSAPR